MRFEHTMRGVALVAAALLVAAVGPEAALAKKKKAKTPPPPYFAVNPGEKILYFVPGHINDNTETDTVATAVNCTNVGFPNPVDVRVEVWNNPDNAPVDQLTQAVDPGESETWESQSIVYMNGGVLPGNPFVSDGSLRIVQIGPGKVICRASQVLNPEDGNTNVQSARDLPVIPFGKEASAGGKKK